MSRATTTVSIYFEEGRVGAQQPSYSPKMTMRPAGGLLPLQHSKDKTLAAGDCDPKMAEKRLN